MLPHGLASALKRIPLHLAGFAALGFGFEWIARYVAYSAFLWVLFFGGWRAWAEARDYSEGEDTRLKAIIDFVSQFTGAAAGILIAWRVH